MKTLRFSASNLGETTESTEHSIETAKAEIKELHAQAMASCRTTIKRALEIGAKLSEVKRLLKHGQWCNWVDTNLDFDVRTAQNYLRLHQNRIEVLARYETISSLGVTDTYRALARFPKKVRSVRQTPDHTAQESIQKSESATTTEEFPEERPSRSDEGNEHELFVGVFSSAHAEEILEFIRSLGVNHENYQVLRADGQIQRLRPNLQAKIFRYLNPTN